MKYTNFKPQRILILPQYKKAKCIFPICVLYLLKKLAIIKNRKRINKAMNYQSNPFSELNKNPIKTKTKQIKT